MHVMGSPWLIAAITLTAIAAAVLGLLVLPRQGSILARLADRRPQQPAQPAQLPQSAQPAAADLSPAPVPAQLTARLGMLTGVFNLLWATVTVLMILRPGSSTGA